MAVILNYKDKWFLAITLFYIAYMVFPAVHSLMPIPEWFLCGAVSISLFLLYPHCIERRFFAWFAAYFFVLFVYCAFDHPFHINGVGDSTSAIKRLLIEVAWTLPGLLACSIIIKLNNPLVYRKLAIWILALMALSVISLIPSLVSQGRILRENLISLDTEDIELASALPGYTLMSCYVFIIPVFLYGIKCYQGRAKLLCFLLFILFVYLIIKTEITTSVIGVIILSLCALLYNNKVVDRSKSFLALGGSLILVWFLYEMGVFLYIADLLVNLFKDTVAQTKFIEFRDMLMGKGIGGNLQIRRALRNQSLQCFFQDPFCGSINVGGHSSLLDRLGSMGLLGFIPYLLMLIEVIRFWDSRMKDRNTKFFYRCGVGVILVFLYMKGLFGGEGMLFMTILLPVSLVGMHTITDKTL